MDHLEIEAHSSYVNKVVFAKNDKSFFSLGFNGEIKRWNTETKQLMSNYEGHTKTVNGLIFFDNDKRMVSISGDGFIKLWDVASPQPILKKSTGKIRITSILKTSTSEFWITTTGKKLIKFDLDLNKIFEIKLESKNTSLFDYNEAHDIMALGGLGGHLYFVNGSDGKLIMDLDTKAVANSGLKFLDDNEFLVLSMHGKLSKYTMGNWSALNHKNLSGDNFYSLSIEESRNIVAISCAHKVMILDSGSMNIQNIYETKSKGNYGLSFSNSGGLLALGSADKKVRIWAI